MSVTDYLKISEMKIFKEAFVSIPNNTNKPLNLISIRDSVLFTWDFSNNCVLVQNIKAARSQGDEKIVCQRLLPLHPPLFIPEVLETNESGNLLAISGPNGILVMQLPSRCPPFGAFDSNKELVYCRSYSLDERLLSCSDTLHVRKVKFHPGSVSDNHILALTSDNMLRLYQVGNSEAVIVKVCPVGEKPGGNFPGSKTTFLDLFGEIAVDFDFSFPEIIEDNNYKSTKQCFPPGSVEKVKKNSMKNALNQHENLIWPIYILRSDFSVFTLNIDLNNNRSSSKLKGPCLFSLPSQFDENDSCSIICLKTLPQIICIANSRGTIINSILLNIDQKQKTLLHEKSLTYSDKELLVFEIIELELGLSVAQEEEEVEEESNKFKCPVILHKDELKSSRFFASHSAGVHMININSVEELTNFIQGSEDSDPTTDIFINPSSSEYLVCTKTANSVKSNPILGFSLYYEPTSIITLLSDKSVVSLGILTAPVPKEYSLISQDYKDENSSPFKKMINEPFDQYIQKILKKGVSRPLLKLSSTSNKTPEDSYELIQRAAQMFREEHFKHFTKAKEELDKRIHTISLLKKAQNEEMEKMNNMKESLRERAENIAEKYEDIKDKQDQLLKRCEQLVMLVSRKKAKPSESEKTFMQDMQKSSVKSTDFQNAIDKLKKKKKYQEIQIQSWKSQESKKIPVIGAMQSNTIKENIKESTQKINDMIKQVNEYKAMLNLK